MYLIEQLYHSIYFAATSRGLNVDWGDFPGKLATTLLCCVSFYVWFVYVIHYAISHIYHERVALRLEWCRDVGLVNSGMFVHVQRRATNKRASPVAMDSPKLRYVSAMLSKLLTVSPILSPEQDRTPGTTSPLRHVALNDRLNSSGTPETSNSAFDLIF